MSRHTWKMILGAALSATVVTACSNGGDKTADPNPAENKPRTPAEIVFYTNNGDSAESFDYRFGNSLRKKFPEYTIKYITSAQEGMKLPELLAAGTRIDIFMQSIGNFEAQAFEHGIQYDMTEMISKYKIDLNKLEPSVVEAVKQASGGKFYALPVFTNNLIMYYNKDVFDKFGVAHPKDGMMWEEMLDINKKLTRTEGDVQYYGYTHSAPHTIRMNPLSIPLVDMKTEQPTVLQDDRWKRFYEAFFIEPTLAPTYLDGVKKVNKLPDINNFVKDKNVGMFGYLSSLLYVWEDQFKALNWDMVSLPTLKEQKGVGSQSYPSYFGVTNMAKDKDAIAEVLKYMISEEFQAELARKGIMPVLNDDKVKKELGKESVFKDKNWNAIFYNKLAPIPPKQPYDATIVGTYSSIGTQMAMDKMDLNSGRRKAEEDSAKAIAAYKSK